MPSQTDFIHKVNIIDPVYNKPIFIVCLEKVVTHTACMQKWVYSIEANYPRQPLNTWLLELSDLSAYQCCCINKGLGYCSLQTKLDEQICTQAVFDEPCEKIGLKGVKFRNLNLKGKEKQFYYFLLKKQLNKP